MLPLGRSLLGYPADAFGNLQAGQVLSIFQINVYFYTLICILEVVSINIEYFPGVFYDLLPENCRFTDNRATA